MKKLSVFLAVVLLCGMLASCDLSGGLIAELFGEQYKDVDPVIEMPTTEQFTCECIDPDHHGGYNYPENGTEIWTEGCEETWEDIDCVIDDDPIAVYVVINCIDAQFMDNDIVCVDNFYTSDTRDEPDRAGVVLEGDLSISYGGWIAMIGVDEMLFGYSFDKDSEPVYSESFSVEATPEVAERVAQVGGTYAAAFYVSIPADELELGAQRIYLWAHNKQKGFTYRFCELEVIKAEGIR